MRTFKKLAIASSIVAALLVSGCGATGGSDPQTIDLKDSAKVAELCGDNASKIASIVRSAAEAKEGSGKRNKLSDWGLDPKNTEQIKATRAALDGRAATACGTPAAAPSASPTGAAPAPHTEGKVPVAGPDGKREDVMSLSGGEIPNGDTTKKEQMPSLAGDLLLNCGTLQGWDTLVPCIEQSKQGGKWYIDKVNAMHAEGKIQFSWSDVQKWAKAKTKKGNLPEARVIEVFGYTQAEMPVEKARTNVAELLTVKDKDGVEIVNGLEVANRLEVAYHQSPFLDTLRPKFKDQEETPSILEFADYIKQVRVSLVPLVLDKDGFAEAKVKDSWSGIFVDCYNIWGKWAFMPPSPSAELVCPPGTELAGKPVPMDGRCSPPTVVTPPPPVVVINVCPPEMPHGTWPVCKDGVEAAPQNQGNLPVQQMPNVLPALPEHRQPVEPANPGPVYVEPPAAPAPAPAPVGNEPAPAPNDPGPRPIAPPETGAPSGSSTCIVAPGKTSC